LGGKRVSMHSLVGCQDYADFIAAIPAFSSCPRDALEAFVTHDVVRVHCAAGKRLNPLTDQEQNLYVLASGSAQLNADDDVVVTLEPGDFFGKSPARQHHLVARVVAVSDAQILVIKPHEVARLLRTSSGDKKPSAATRPPSPTEDRRPQRTARRGRRSAELVGRCA
jgi:CRP-like cAMP-binding protein